MWWTGRHPGMTEEEDAAFRDEERRTEALGPELVHDIAQVLGDHGPNGGPNSSTSSTNNGTGSGGPSGATGLIPSVSFERTPADYQSNSLIRPREVHVRGRDGSVGSAVVYKGPAKQPYYRISNTEAPVVLFAFVWLVLFRVELTLSIFIILSFLDRRRGVE